MAPSPLAAGLAGHLGDRRLGFLASARVGIAGCGGLGSNAAMLLARSGVGAFTLVDFDRVEASNLNRQFFWPGDVGRSKPEALADRLRGINPALAIDVSEARLDSANARDLFGCPEVPVPGGPPRCRAVIEALDSARGKAMLCDALGDRVGLLVCASGVAGWGGPPMRVRPLGPGVRVVGDLATETAPGVPPMAPRVMMAAALQADAVLAFLLESADDHPA